uniref:Uncharacterized protein n=1 Tax=Anguilla anguilla TaxID=7936 RepID=A0A0E9WCD2_ANGAN
MVKRNAAYLALPANCRFCLVLFQSCQAVGSLQHLAGKRFVCSACV